jgi:hypothetical protein
MATPTANVQTEAPSAVAKGEGPCCCLGYQCIDAAQKPTSLNHSASSCSDSSRRGFAIGPATRIYSWHSLQVRFCPIHKEPLFSDYLQDNLAFIATSRLGRDTTLDHFKFSLLLGGGRLYLMYGESLILKGTSDGDPGNAVIGLFEQSMDVIEDCMENANYTW